MQTVEYCLRFSMLVYVAKHNTVTSSKNSSSFVWSSHSMLQLLGTHFCPFGDAYDVRCRDQPVVGSRGGLLLFAVTQLQFTDCVINVAPFPHCFLCPASPNVQICLLRTITTIVWWCRSVCFHISNKCFAFSSTGERRHYNCECVRDRRRESKS